MFKIAELKHLDAIINIENNVFEQPWSKIHFLKDIELNVSYNLVYMKNSECIGYTFGYIIKNEYHLNNIAIKSAYQQKGLGNKMLNYIISDLKSKKINKIFLEVKSDNFSAIKLYDSIGFNKVNVRKDYYKKGKDAFLYNLDLN